MSMLYENGGGKLAAAGFVKVNAFTNLLINSRRYADIKKIYTVCLTAGTDDGRQSF